MALYRMLLDDEFAEPYYERWRPNFAKVAQLYIESPEAQHGDHELAEWEAMVWWGLFLEATSDA